MDITFHANPTQKHQLEHGEWLKKGLRRHNLDLQVASDFRESDIHIVSGPHYAKNHFINHPKVILLDRAYYHDELSGKWVSMDWVSLGWMEDGIRRIKKGEGRSPPIRKDRPTAGGTIFLADFNGPVERADTIRRHPQETKSSESLTAALRRHTKAIGYQTTALVKAGLEGLEIVCKDPRNIMYQENWIELLPYADWHYSEIINGDIWEHLEL